MAAQGFVQVGKHMLLWGGVCAVSGCMAFKTAEPPKEVDDDAPVETVVEQSILKSADRIHASLERLTDIMQANSPKPKPVVPPSSGSMAQPVTFSWSGNMEAAVETLAAMAEWRFRVEGSPPPSPVLVHVEARGRPIYEVLRDIGLQAGVYAGVSLMRSSRTVVVSYLGVHR